MAGASAEPFHIAHLWLRDRLYAGDYPPGRRITAVEVADALGLSTTPVREALSRLAGEGALEDRRGQGYFVRTLRASDVADLYRMSLACLLIAQDPQRTPREVRGASLTDEMPDPVLGIDALFLQWVANGGSRSLVLGLRNLQGQLGPVRRREPMVFEDLQVEAEALVGLGDAARRGDRIARVRQFHGRRIRAAGGLAALLEAPAEPPGK